MPRIVFFHVPKCAGSTVYTHLEKYLGKTRFERVLGRRPTVLVHTKHHADFLDEKLKIARKARLVYGHFDWSTYAQMGASDQDFRFTFLRDPVERLQSAYNFYCSDQGWKAISLAGTHEEWSFRDFLTNTDESTFWQLDNVMVRMFGGQLDQKFTTAAEWEGLLEVAKQNLDSLNFVGFQNSFGRDLEKLCGLIGVGGKQIVTNNATNHKKTYERDDELLALIDRCTKWDQKLYDYAMEKFA